MPPSPTSARVLVVDDDDSIRLVVRWQLEEEGYEVIEAADGTSALAAVADRRPDLVVLDLSLPGIGGLDVLRLLRRGRAGDATCPVIVLSGRSDESDRIVGLDLGADDYLVKPFSPGELAARVRSVLRRTAGAAPDRAVAGGLVLDKGARSVEAEGTTLTLTTKEFDLLLFLVEHPRQVFSRGQLLDRVWRSSPEWLGEATVTEHVHRLRHKLEGHPRMPHIRTVRGVGYLLEVAP